jgi:hypothetical protein
LQSHFFFGAQITGSIQLPTRVAHVTAGAARVCDWLRPSSVRKTTDLRLQREKLNETVPRPGRASHRKSNSSVRAVESDSSMEVAVIGSSVLFWRS